MNNLGLLTRSLSLDSLDSIEWDRSSGEPTPSSSQNSTPLSSPKKSSSFPSPVKHMLGVTKELKGYSPCGKSDKNKIKFGLEAVRHSPPAVVRRIWDEVFNPLVGNASEAADKNTALTEIVEESKTHKQIHRTLYEHGFENGYPLIPLIVRIEHILNPKGASGWHFCPQNDPRYDSLQDKVHSTQGSFAARFTAKGAKKSKFSTFFPSSITCKNELAHLIAMSREIAKYKDRTLRLPEGRAFYIEAYLNGCTVRSAFPLFYFSQWEEGCIYQVAYEKEETASGVVFECARKLIEEYAKPTMLNERENPIRYAMKRDVIIDVAPAFAHWGVEKGIFFQFPKSAFESDEGFHFVMAEM